MRVKLCKVNISVFKKLNKLKLEKESLIAKLDELTGCLTELIVEKESLDFKLKSLTNDLDKSNAQLQTFSSKYKKIDNMISLNKPAGNRRGLGLNETNSLTDSSSKNKFVLASKLVVQNLRPRVAPRFIPTCQHCGKVGYIRHVLPALE